MSGNKSNTLPEGAEVVRSVRRMSAAELLAYLHRVRNAGYEAGFREGSQLREELDKIKDIGLELGTGKEPGAC